MFAWGCPKSRGKKEYHLTFCQLIKAAQNHSVVTYKEICTNTGFPATRFYLSKVLGQLLGEISDEENIHGRPMLSALAVGKNGFPGDGFFILAKSMGRSLDETPKGKRAFWESEKKAVYEAWK